MKNRLSISFRITLSIIFLFTIILAIIGLAVVHSTNLFLTREAESQLMSTMGSIEKELDSEENEHDIDEMVEELPTKPSVEVSIFRPDGTRLYIANPIYRIPMLSEAGISEVNTSEPLNGDSNAGGRKSPGYHALVLRSEPANISLPLIVQISKILDEEDQFLTVLKRFLFFADLAGILITFVVGFTLSRRILRPVDDITRTARNISFHDLSKRIPENGPDDELRRLSRAFNDMLDRLEEAFSRQNRFVSDASHELRTPLSIISGYTGMLRRWAKSDPSVLEESIEAIKAETSRMQALIERLLFLARTDNGMMEVSREELSLNQLIEGTVKDIRHIAPERDFVFESSREYLIHGDKELLRQMLFIFLENSIRYSDAKRRIEIGLTSRENGALLTVRDYGPGMDQEMSKRIFDRFYRVDDSRDKKSGGTGLGLSIAKEIIDMHGGQVSVHSTQGEGTVFLVLLPWE